MVNLISYCLWKPLWNLQCETSKGDESSIQYLVQELLFCILKSKMSGFLSMCRTPKRIRSAMVRYCIVALICAENVWSWFIFWAQSLWRKEILWVHYPNETTLDINCLNWPEQMVNPLTVAQISIKVWRWSQFLANTFSAKVTA